MSRTASNEGRNLRPGDTVRHYQIIRLLGRGGGGEVYAARDTQLGRKVALKMIRPAMLDSKEAVERFVFEARATAKFNHPHIITIYEVGTHEGAPYVALEYLEGRSLRQLLRERRLQLKEALRIGVAVAEALQEAHAAGILHRDLKPENVFIPRDGRLRVLDFGLAKRLDTGPSPAASRVDDEPIVVDDLDPTSGVTQADTSLMGPPLAEDEGATLGRAASGTVAALDDSPSITLAHFGSRGFDSSGRRGVRGTPPYMAPEQWRHERQAPATDIWALGIMLYELVTGLLPFPALERSAIRAKVLSDNPMLSLRGNSGLPAELTTLIARCLEKDPAQRPDVGTVRATLAELLVPATVDLEELQGPFRGLFAFDERHAHLFFGRDGEVAAFVEQLRTDAALAVVGPTGAGKSSFVQAGVVPRLREQGPWVVLRMRPGRDPFRSLAARVIGGDQLSEHISSATAAAAGAGERMLAAELDDKPMRLGLALRQIAAEQQVRVLLLVDQLEELYTQVEDESVRERFLSALASVADEVDDPIRLVVTLRDDFLGRIAVGPAASKVLGRIVVLRRPDLPALHQIVTRTPHEFGYDYDDALLAREIVAAVAAEQACLPLLSFAGRMLWERRDRERRRLTRQAYEAMGGVVGALATHADAVIDALPSAGREVARGLLQRLVSAEGTRRLVTRQSLIEGEGQQAEEVLARLVDARLVVVRRQAGAEASCELVHEALIGAWRQLARWLDESREERAFAQELEQAATLWAQRGRREDEVWQGEALAEAQASVERFGLAPGQEADAFLRAGRLRQQQREHAARRRRATLRLSVGLGVVLTVALLAGWGVTLRTKADEARRERERAEKQLVVAQRQGALLALDQGQLLRARALARAALEGEIDRDTRRLWWELEQAPRIWRHRLAKRPLRAAFAPDGRRVVLTLDKGPLLELDLASLAERELVPPQKEIRDAAYVADDQLATIDSRGEVALLHPASGKQRRLGLHGEGGQRRDGQLLVARKKGVLYSFRRRMWRWSLHADTRPEVVEPTGVARLVGLVRGEAVLAVGFPGLAFYRAGERLFRLERGVERPVGLVDISSDGKLLATASMERHATLEVHRLDTKDSCRVNTQRWVSALRLSRDGRWLALGTRAGGLQLWDPRRCLLLAEVDLAAGERSREPGVHVWTVLLTFDAAGGRLLAGAMHGELQLFDVATLVAGSRKSHRRALTALTFTGDGRELISGDVDGEVRVWDRERRLKRWVRLSCRIGRLIADSPRRLLYVGCERGASQQLDLETLRPRARYLVEPVSLRNLVLSPDGKIVAGAFDDDRVRAWEADSGRRVARFAPKTGARDLIFDAKGKLLTIGGKTRSLASYELPSGRLHNELELPRGIGNSGAVAMQLMNDGRVALRLGAHDLAALDPTSGKSERLAPARGPLVTRSILDPGDDQIVVVPYDAGWGLGRAFLLGRRDTRAAELFRGARGQLTALAFSRDKLLLAAGTLDGQLQLWRRDARRPLQHAVLLVTNPPRLLTVGGVKDAPGAPARKASKSWQQRAIEAGWLAAADEAQRWLCLATYDGHVELWEMAGDRRLVRVPRDKIAEVVTIPGACAIRWEKGAELIAAAAAPRMLSTDATALGRHAEQLFVVRKAKEIERFDRHGEKRETLPRVLAHPQIIVPSAEGIVLAETGQLVVQQKSARMTMRLPLAVRPSAARLLSRELVAVGYASGALEVYQLADGRRLARRQLDGPITWLEPVAGVLHVVTDQEDWRAVDLSAMTLGACALLRRVWQASPARWQAGELVRAAPPAAHRCAPR